MWPPTVKPVAQRIVYFTNSADDKKSLPAEVCVLEPGVSVPIGCGLLVAYAASTLVIRPRGMPQQGAKSCHDVLVVRIGDRGIDQAL
jgi:hypothetical protein